MSGSILIRRATAADAPAVRRLAALDSARVPRGEVLLAEVGGEPLAAISLADDRVVADPFRRTAELAALLRVRARQLRAEAPAAAPLPLAGRRVRPA